jgi:hypothetical protein
MLDGDEKGYAIAAVRTVYFAALVALHDTEAPTPDAFESLLAQLSGPSDGASHGPTLRWACHFRATSHPKLGKIKATPANNKPGSGLLTHVNEAALSSR